MINKIVGYGGFKSYGEEHYPTRKQGKQLQLNNQIWSSTKRDVDKVNPLDNYNHYHTNYKKNHLQNTQPKDYHPEHVVRGSQSTLNFNPTSTTKAYDQLQAQKQAHGTYKNGFNLLKTGTQHWKSNYQGSICQPAINNKTQSQRKNQSKGKPYINDAQTGITDYKFNFGEKVGSTPLQLLSHSDDRQPIRNHPLKHGTNQLWTEIPGYQGFKPSQLHFEQLKAKIQQRKSVQKGNKKLNLIQNYHINVPGYAGYKPKYDIKTNQLRDSCFQYKKK